MGEFQESLEARGWPRTACRKERQQRRAALFCVLDSQNRGSVTVIEFCSELGLRKKRPPQYEKHVFRMTLSRERKNGSRTRLERSSWGPVPKEPEPGPQVGELLKVFERPGSGSRTPPRRPPRRGRSAKAKIGVAHANVSLTSGLRPHTSPSEARTLQAFEDELYHVPPPKEAPLVQAPEAGAGKRTEDCLSLTVDYAMLCSDMELGGAISQINAVANFGGEVPKLVQWKN